MSTWIDNQPQDKIDAALVKYRATPPSVASYADGDERFGLWLYLVDRRLTRAVGVGLFDLADWCIRDAYESGWSPLEAAREALESDDTFSSLMD